MPFHPGPNEHPPSYIEMSSTRQYPAPSFPSRPPALAASSHEMQDFQSVEIAPRKTPFTDPHITPYLGLQARLSQIWINRWTVLLFLVLVRTLVAVASLNKDLDHARTEAQSACTGVESMGSAMASMPHYMSQGVNELAASGVEKAVNGFMALLLLSVTGVEEIVVFIINMMTSTYVCLITLVVSGSLHVALKLIEDVSAFLNNTLTSITTDIHAGIDGFQKDINKFTSALNNVPSFFGSSSSTVPKLNIDGPLDKLSKLQIPSSLDEGLNKLNSSIPNFDQVHNVTNNLIRIPFESIKKAVNESMTYKFDRSIFPVPQKKVLTFCSDNNSIGSFFDKLQDIAEVARKVFIAVLTILAILACIPMAYREIRGWRSMRKRVQLFVGQDRDPLDVVEICTRPYTSQFGLKLASRFKSPRRQALVRWCVAYGTSTPSLFVLSLGAAGLFACLCQYILLKAVEKEAPALINEVGEFAGQVVGILNNASQQWADDSNRAIDATVDKINHDLLGWVDDSTTALNKTLNQFSDLMIGALNITFKDTVLYEPVTGLYECLIGLKVAGIQKAVDWVHDHAHVDFPHVRNDTFSLGAAASISQDSKNASDSFLADPTSQATDKISNIVAKLLSQIGDGIRKEAIISSFVILVWVIIALIGIIRTAFLFSKYDKTRGEGGPATYTGENRVSPRLVQHAFPAQATMRGGAGPGPINCDIYPSFSSSQNSDSHSHNPFWHSDDETKEGFAGERTGASIDKGHNRASSHGFFVDEKR
ncbi:MAG: plasma membrane fusion protein prm1 [Trizodia sp. TS-e1964]|nr:MAG: plasma membrane fusion protein prm1 [Trizodia sp. TS-e1964]